MDDGNDKTATLLVTAEKLVHPLAEVRRRAVQSLDFKLKHQLVTASDICKEHTVLKSLLDCLRHEDNGLPTDAAVLMLLAKSAATPTAARQLLHLGAEELLTCLQESRPAELHAVATAPNPAPLQRHGRQVYSSTAARPIGGWVHGVDGSRPHTSARSWAFPGSPQQLRHMPQGPPQPVFTYSASRPDAHSERNSSLGPTGPWVDSQRSPLAVGAVHGRPAAPRHVRSHHSLEQAQDGSDLATKASSRDWLLRPVALGQENDQQLFELSIKLKYAGDPRVVLPALLQLHSASLLDLPVEAVASRHGILNHLLVLLTSTSSRPDVVNLAAKCLLRIVTLLKRALLLGTDPALVCPGGGAALRHSGVEAVAPPASTAASPTAMATSPRTHGLGMGAAGAAAEAQFAEGQRLLPQALPQRREDGVDGSAVYSRAAEDEPVNVTILTYLIALKAFQALRDPTRIFAVAPLVEELVPLLLLGRDGPLAAAEERDRIKWAQLLQVLSQALVANLSMARAESPPIVQASVSDSGAHPSPPVLNAPSAALLALSARLVSALPPGLWTPEVVPAAMTEALATVARDDVLTALIPGLRSAVLPPLAALRPDVAAILDVAAAGEAALAAGSVLLGQLPLLRTGDLAPAAWLQQLQLALPALDLPDQEALLEGVMQGLALICGGGAVAASAADTGWSSAAGGGEDSLQQGQGPYPRLSGNAGCRSSLECHGGVVGEGATRGGAEREPELWVGRAEETFLQLLSHPSPTVAMACLGLLEGLVQDAARTQPDHPLLRLLTRKAVLERLVVLGLADERTRRQVARILMGIMPDADCQSCIQEWSCWVRLYEADAQVGVLAAALSAGMQRYVSDAQPPVIEVRNWRWLQPVLLDLFSADADSRRVASRRLAEGLQVAGALTMVDGGESYTADPFRVCLDGGARDDLVVPAANPRLARSFRAADVTNLLAILANPELALELRRSAAEQMLALAAEERLREVMVEAANLRAIACVATLRDPSSGLALSASQAGALASQGLAPPTPDLLSTLDVQLPIAAVNLLFVLAAHSPGVRAWLTRDSRYRASASVAGSTPAGPGGGSVDTGEVSTAAGAEGGLEMLLSGILPLVFHSMVTVRRAVARLLAALSFGCEADRWSGWAGLASAAAATAPTAAPATGGTGAAGIQAGSKAVRPAGNSGGGGTGLAGDTVCLPVPFQRAFCFPCRITWVALPPVWRNSREPGVLEGLPRMQDLLAEQRALVVLLIQERQAMRACGGDPAGLLTLMNERPDCLGGFHRGTLHAIAASIRAVAPEGLVSRCLATVQAAGSHAACTSALRSLQMVCSTRQGVAALATADWQGRLENLLGTCPTSPEDRALWVELLEPLRRMVLSGALSQQQLLQLATHLQLSTRQALSASGAAADPPYIPLALAGNTALAGDPRDAHEHLVCTQLVLATLVDLVRCARMELPVQQSLRVLMALAPTPLLHMLGTAYIGNQAANYGCRLLAVQLLAEAAALLAAAAEADGVTVSALDVGLQDALLLCFKTLLQNISEGFAAAASAAPQLAAVVAGGDVGGIGASGVSLAVAAAAAGDRSRHQQAGGFAGKGAVRLAMQSLLHITNILPLSEWAPLWQQLSGSFWVSRLLRDRDSVLRTLAAEVLACLMRPGADGLHAMVAQGWPDAVKMAAKIATDTAHCYALRTAALRVLVCCMPQRAAIGQAAPTTTDRVATSVESLPRRQLFASTISLPPAAQLLQNTALWDQLPAVLQDPHAPVTFVAATLSLLLQGLLLDGERTAGLLAQPGTVDRLLRLLTVPALPPSGSELYGSKTDAARRGQGHGYHEPSDREAVVQLLGLPVEPGRGREPGGAAEVGSSGGVAAVPLSCAAWEDAATALYLESCAGMEAAVRKQEHRSVADPANTRHHLYGLRCAALAAQLLAQTHQDPPLMALPLLGLPLADVAKALLTLFARMAAGAASLNAVRAMQTAALAAEGAARLEAARHAAVAANAVLQLLDEQEAHKALIALDASLARVPGPLLPHCAEVLLSDCSCRALRMAVVCLVATLLARRDTAARLLCFEMTDDEYLINSTGGEVGAGLCAALIELLPDDALIPTSDNPSLPESSQPSASPRPLHPPASTRASAFSLGMPGHRSPPATSRHTLEEQEGQEGRTAAVGAEAHVGLDFKPSSLCVIVSLRNVLAYSHSAKDTALRTGFHRVLLQACSRGAALLAVPAKRQQQQQPLAASSGGPERASAASGAPTIAGRGPNRRPTVARASRKAVTEARREVTPAQPASSTPRGPQPSVRTSLPSAATDVLTQPAAYLAEGEEELLPPEPLPSASPARGHHIHAGRKGAAHDARTVARRAAEQKVVASLSLLRHLALASHPSRQRLVADGMMSLLRSLWPIAAAATSGPLFHELLSCLANLLPGCADARARLTQEGQGGESGTGSGGDAESLLGHLLTALFGPQRLEAPTFSLAVGVLLHLTATEDGTQLLLKSPFLAQCQRALQDVSAATTASGRQAAREMPRQASLMQVLVNVAGCSEGQRALLRSTSGPGLLELVVRLVSTGPDGAPPSGPHPQTGGPPAAMATGPKELAGLRVAALALLRNLCFAAEAKTHLLAHPAVLPALVAAAEGVVESPQGAAYAASGLWALCYHGEKVKAALRRVPSAHQRLVAAQAACRFQEERLKAQKALVHGPHPASVGLDGSTASKLSWMEQAKIQLSGLLGAMSATTQPGGRARGEGFDSAGATWGPDRSPLRDQNVFSP